MRVPARPDFPEGSRKEKAALRTASLENDGLTTDVTYGLSHLTLFFTQAGSTLANPRMMRSLGNSYRTLFD